MRRGGSTDAAAIRAVGRLGLALAALGLAPGSALAAGADSPGVGVEVSFTSDDNVNRGAEGETLSDRVLGVRLSASAAVPISTRTRAVILGFAGAERFNTYSGLSRNFIGAQGDFKYRASGDFGAATWGAFVRTAAEFYESDLRDGYRHGFGVNVVKPLTDRIQVFGVLAGNITDGSSTVFDTRNVSLRGNADWSFTRWDVVYLGLEYRQGDIVSSMIPTLATAGISPHITDDAFNDGREAYRFKARVWITTLGYNHAFGAGHSVDIAWRRAQATALDPSSGSSYSASDLRYVVSQFSLAYLARF
jgi:hypothetical protein